MWTRSLARLTQCNESMSDAVQMVTRAVAALALAES